MKYICMTGQYAGSTFVTDSTFHSKLYKLRMCNNGMVVYRTSEQLAKHFKPVMTKVSASMFYKDVMNM